LFSLPGLGTAYITAMSSRDYPVVTGINLLIAATVLLINLIVDVSYVALDPRIKYS